MRLIVRWGVVPLFAAVLLAGLIVPKAGPRRGVQNAVDSAWVAYSAASREARAVRALRWRVEAREIARGVGPVTAAAPVVRIAPAVSPRVAEILRTALREELRAAAPRGSAAPIALVATLDTGMRNGMYRITAVRPQSAGDPCVVIVETSGPHADRVSLSDNQRLLGVCAFYAAFGASGAGMTAFLDSSRSASARYLVAPPAYADDRIRSLSSPNAWSGSDDIDVLGCRSGRRDACTRFAYADAAGRYVLEEDQPARSDEMQSLEPRVAVAWSGAENGQLQAGLLAAIARDIGAERFGAIWRGERSLEEALQAEGGISLAQWVSDYVTSRTTRYAAGPGTDPVATIFGLGLAVGLMLASVRFAKRRMT